MLKEETGVSASLKYLGKFIHKHPPEHEIVAVFGCTSDDAIRVNESESSYAIFCSVKQIDKIVSSMKVTPWLRDGWKLVGEKWASHLQ